MSSLLKKMLIALPIIGGVIVIVSIWTGFTATIGNLIWTVFIFFLLLLVVEWVVKKVDIPDNPSMSTNFKSGMIILASVWAFIGMINVRSNIESEFMWKLYATIAVLFFMLLIIYAILLWQVKRKSVGNHEHVFPKSTKNEESLKQ